MPLVSPHTPPSGSLYRCLSPLALPYTQLEVLSTLPWCVWSCTVGVPPNFVQRRQERSSHCWPFAPPKPAQYPCRLREYCMRRPENGFRKLPSLLRHAGSLACHLVNVVDELPDHALPEAFRLQLASVEWPGLRCLLYTAVMGESPPQDPQWQTPCCDPSPL